MTTTHTPGPWQYTFEGGTVAFIVEADGTTVAKLSATENSTAHSALPSNARLIATAPDLLAALQRCLRYGGLYPDLADEVRAAITRATGA
jgi:hypothetical protein